MDYSCVLIMIVAAFLCVLQVGLSETDDVYEKNFISWDDMKVDEQWLNTSRVDYNQSRIIIVDKHGGGDSVTVQGAIDMVPENNKQRMKIYILPGIYRFECIIHNYLSFFLFTLEVPLAGCTSTSMD